MWKYVSIDHGMMSSSRERETIVGIGTNLGDRRKNILTAAEFLDTRVSRLEFSPVFDTRPLGAASRNSFLNCVCRFFWRSGPYDLLRVLQDIESCMGRRRCTKWGDRIVDLDILSMADIRISDSALTIPHPSYLQRSFVLLPLFEMYHSGVVPGIESGLFPYLNTIESTGWRRVFNPPTRRRGIWDMN